MVVVKSGCLLTHNYCWILFPAAVKCGCSHIKRHRRPSPEFVAYGKNRAVDDQYCLHEMIASQTEDLSDSSSDSNELNLSCSFLLFNEHEIADRQSEDEDEPNPSVAEDESGTVKSYMFEPEPSDDEASLNMANESDDDDEDAGGWIGNTEW